MRTFDPVPFRPDWETMSRPERDAWRLIMSWARGGVLVEQAHLAQRAN